MARTLLDKIWDRHVVASRGDMDLLHVDRHLLHDGSFHAFNGLRERGLSLARPDLTFGTPDHYVPTRGRRADDAATPEIAAMIAQYERNVGPAGLTSFGLGDPRQGIVHVVGPEQGITLPGTILVCGDSHTSTHGALGAIAFGIGQSENLHVLATQTLWQIRPRHMRVRFTGSRPPGTTAKDMILAMIGRIGAAGAVGHAIEYDGPAVGALGIEERLTLCNMSIEAGARLGIVAADEKTFAYLEGRPFAPQGAAWAAALVDWRTLVSDPGARFDRDVEIDTSDLHPMVTWGTTPDEVIPIGGRVPDPAANSGEQRVKAQRAIEYMGLQAGQEIAGLPVDRVFIGSCTNGRIEDLRAAAAILRGRRAVVPTMVVPGSGLVREQAEAEGIARDLVAAGVDWRHAGCSMCAAMNGDTGQPGQRIAATSNRNFEGRQGRGVRTHLMSPAMAAAAAVTGRLFDVRQL
jgi:3-isopropylmalate/(R)-2-methylmalate dehydratase large subunit